MGSSRENGRRDDSKRGAGDPRRRRLGRPLIESLENRRLLSGGTEQPRWHPTSSDPFDVQNGPLANLGQDLVTAYHEFVDYEAGGGKGGFASPLFPRIKFNGSYVGIDARGTGDFASFEQSLQTLGMYVGATDPALGIAEGYFPLANLPKLASAAQTIAATPIYSAVAFQQGIANNEADAVLNGPAVRSTFGVDGTGQKVGVLSTSASDYLGGLADSVKTGDLPPNVQIIQDYPAGGPPVFRSDEGRAMLEQIHDIAPGAGLGFATAFIGEVSFANNIKALGTAGYGTIVDDAGYFLDPFYQDGVIQQAVNTVVSQGATYLSSAGNQSDSGYESTFRGVSATVPALGAGRYMNFDPSGATQATSIGVNVYASGAIVMQFDQPFYTPTGVVSNVELDVLDANGTLVAQANTNTIAAQQPVQITGTLPAGLYQVVVKVDAGPDPGHVVFYATGDAGFSVDHKFGSAGQTFYPSTHGHNAGAQTISVGATPFWGSPPFSNPANIFSEPFSSTGPVINEFSPTGVPITPTVLLKPDVSAPDGVNTTFFSNTNGVPDIIDTSRPISTANPPYPGNPPTTFTTPPTATNQSQANLPAFFGTSAAAPDLAAVAALVKQANPTITRDAILADFIGSAVPLNFAAKGVWNPQGGFGLVNSVSAIALASELRVQAVSPGGGSTIALAPTSITVTFSKPVDIRTVTPSILAVGGANGATVAVGQPVGVDSPTFPTVVQFPITITPAPGRVANGVYTVFVGGGTVVGQGGQVLKNNFSDTFNLQQVNAPQVVNTAIVGRYVSVAFSEPMNPAAINPANLFIIRANGGNGLFNPKAIIVSSLAGATLFYNPLTNIATFDLSALPQSSLPTDRYAIVARSSITDVVGNRLNGSFGGVFPSGLSPSLASGTDFQQDLGVVQLGAPLITSLSLAPASDSGTPGDNNTNVTTPTLVGQVTSRFPAALGGLQVYVEFNGLPHPGVVRGGLDLAVGANGRGFTGHFDATAVTNAQGQFTIAYPPGLVGLVEGLIRARVLVVGQADSPPLPGLASSQDTAFRVDRSLPYVGTTDGSQATSVSDGAQISNLSSLTLNVVDPVAPQAVGDPFAVDPKLGIPALDPVAAANAQNYQLIRASGPGQTVDESSFIKSATFVSTSARSLTSDPFTGRVNLTFGPGLPSGHYALLALSGGLGYGHGLTDAAGNAFAGTAANSASFQPGNFRLDFDLQPTPTYITAYTAYSADPSTGQPYSATSGPRANYEVPVAGQGQNAPAPPTAFTVDFSNSLNNFGNIDQANSFYSRAVQLVRSANNPGATPDGDFGDFGIANTTGFTRVAGIGVQLVNSVPGAVFGQYGYQNRLLITLPTGSTLPADYYRVYLPNNGPSAISDIFGNQLDGEFLGYQNAANKYVDLLPNGQTRGSDPAAVADLSGDGTPGGAFVTGFVVVPHGNIIYARPDALYNPQIPSQVPDGSLLRPYPVLAPEAVPTPANGGDLNSIVNSGSNFNPVFDRSGLGTFEPSAFFAAQQRVQQTGGPVVILAEPSIPSRDPNTGLAVQRPFVLQAPAGSDPIANNASAAVPALTTLIFEPGSALKMQNAALLVQNQGSALQVLGGPNTSQQVNLTSYKDSSVGGVTNGDPSSIPASGDYGGIVFRNYSQAAIPGSTGVRTSLFPGQIPVTGNPAQDDRLKGPFANINNPASQVDAVSGADDVMSYVNYLVEKYAGGPVPQTNGVRYDGFTLQNSRPTITNTMIARSGGAGSAQAGLSVDVDSLRQDDTASGPLLRGDSFIDDGLNGIYIRAQLSGLAEPTNAVAYASNPSALGGARNYILNDPYPYLLTSVLVVGQQLQVETGGNQNGTADRLYVNPGMLVKFEHGAALEVVSSSASLNVGDQTYIREYDADHTVGPIFPALLPNGQANPRAGQPNPNFKANSSALAKVIFTSLNDDTASTSFFDPISQTTTTIVQPLPAVPGGSGGLQPTPGKVPDLARWGGVSIAAGSVGVINSTILRYGGGAVNTAIGTGTLQALTLNPGNDTLGSHVSITNNEFDDNSNDPTTGNLNAAISIQPNGILAGDPQRPLLSGDPFIHGNVMLRNGYNAVEVLNYRTSILPFHPANLNVNSTWTGGDYSYLLRNTIVLSGGVPNFPSSTQLVAPPTPFVTLTLQATLPGTVLADGTAVAAPGVPLIVKLQGGIASEAPGVNPPVNTTAYWQGGAGFIVGVDDGTDPPTPFERLIDQGSFSDIRIVGLPANQSTGQTRVPVVITSVHDNTVGTTVNGTVMNNAIPNDTTAPAAGDGGVIYFGGNSLTSYNLQDPRSGNLIDNADIRYISRVEQQGGGVLYSFARGADTSFDPNKDGGWDTKIGTDLGGTIGFGAQYNQPKSLTISNSNLSTFSDTGVVAHPGYGSILLAGNYVSPNPGAAYRLAGYVGEPTHTYLVNDTITNMNSTATSKVPGNGTAVSIVSETGDDFPMGVVTQPAMAVMLNDTFYNDGIGINSFAPAANGNNPYSHVAFLVMDSIFANIGTNAVQSVGQQYGSDLQYNLFFNIGGAQVVGGIPNDQPINGDPAFRNAAAGNFFLLPASAAIDRARSELGPSIFGDMLYPSASINNANLNAIPIRNQIGDTNAFGGRGFIPSDADIVTLPGESVTERGFPDLWTPVLGAAAPGVLVPSTGTASATPGTYGTAGNPSTYAYAPIFGERDQQGNLRVKDPNSPNVGFGSRPFFDIGAFEYIIQNPPVVTAVQAVVPVPPSPINLYNPGGIAGTNQIPQFIQVQFNEQLDPTTISGMSVLLLASGGDGIFGNNNSPADRAINLSGKLAFDPKTDILTINTAGVFTAGATLNDEYELVLKGTGSAVIKDRSGLALDGFTNNDALPLPSGSDQFPGSDFLVNFTIDTNAPSLVAGSFRLSPASDTSGGSNITKNTTPTFVGTITDVFPPINPLIGDQVFVDVSTRGDGVFDIIGAATGTTDANGNFSVTVAKPLPNSPFIVNPATGIQGFGDSGNTLARVRVINAAGNASATLTTPLTTYFNTGALTNFEIDTVAPKVVSISPPPNVLTAPNASGQVIVTVTFDQNVKPSTLNANTVLVFRAGGSGVFTGNGVPVPIVANSFTFNYLKTPSGAVTVQFAIQGPLPNDLYRIVLKGTGTAPITDPAGNALDGAGTGTPGSDFTDGPFIVFSPANARLIYVDGTNPPNTPTATRGSRDNPYITITAALAVAQTGDDVLVLPGTYKEDVTLKAQVRLLSADPASTDAGFLPGNQFDTLIYGVPPVPTATNPGGTGTIVVNASNIGAVPGIVTEVSGFSLIAPLLGNSVNGFIDTSSAVVNLSNASVLVDKNYIVNGGNGVNILTSGANAPTPTVESNVIAGNINGVGIDDQGGTTSLQAPTNIINNTITDNTYGLYNFSATANATQADVFNNIFYSNHDLTTARTGTGIFSGSANTLVVGTNLFFSNGPNSKPASNALGTFANFNPAALGGVPDASGNFLGDPKFVSPRDPRPNGDTPPVFFLDGNYDLTGRSPAINAARQSVAPATDILYRKPVKVSGHGTNGSGPASIGAFYYLGTGGIAFNPGNGTVLPVPTTGGIGGPTVPTSGGGLNGVTALSLLAGRTNPTIGGSLPIGTKQFNVVSTSLSADGTSTAAGQTGGVAYESALSFIDVNFSDKIRADSLQASDLILGGPGLDPANPAKATSLAWVDNHTIRFFLTGNFNAAGAVNLAIAPGSITDTRGDTVAGFHDSFQVGSAPTAPTPTTVAIPLSTAQLAGVQPAAVAGPVAVHYGTASKTVKIHTTKPGHAAASKATHAHPVAPAQHQAAQHKAAKVAKAAPKAKKAK